MNDTSAAQRESIVSRIRKLSKFTTASGCTEAEAAAALAKVRELIAQHNVTQDELAVRFEAARCTTDEFIELNASVADWTRTVPFTAKVYRTKCWYSQEIADPLDLGIPQQITSVKFFGLAADVAACIATSSIIYTAVNSEASKFRGGLKAKSSFRLGMIERLCDRLLAMVPAQVVRPTTGTSLVVLKDQLVTEEFAKLNLHLGRGATQHRTAHDPRAYAAGQSAGSRVDLGGGKVTGQRALR